jgi:organic radical activating enzyme
MPSLELTTLIGCPLKCTFCPQDRLQSAYQDSVRSLTESTLATVLSKLPDDVRIDFSGFTEPWSNRNCNKFVKMCLDNRRTIAIYTTLVGMSLEQAKELKSMFEHHTSQFDEIWIHLPDTQGNMPGFRYNTVFQEVLDYFRENFPANFMTMDNSSKIDRNIKGVIKLENWYLHTRANNVNTAKINNTQYHPAPRYEFVTECTREKNYRANVLLPNGDIVLCCMDYGLKHPLGNLLTQSYEDIVNGPEMSKIRSLADSIGYTDDLLCKSCNDAHCRTPWNDEGVKQRVQVEYPDITVD